MLAGPKQQQQHGAADGCGHDHAHDHEHAHDPTLASCCERDERQFARAMALKRLLTAHDPTSGGVRLRQQLFEPPPASSQPQFPSHQASARHAGVLHTSKRSDAGSDDDDDDDDDDFLLDDDDGLDQLFAARREALEAQVRLAAQSVSDGFGVVTESDAAQLLLELRASPDVPRVVLVTSGEADAATHALLAEMARVARKFVGTKFARVAVRGGEDAAARELRLRSAPCVAAFRLGEQVDATPLDSRASADPAVLWEARLVPWLSMCGVLATTREQPSGGATAAAAVRRRATAADEDEDREPPAYDCGVESCRIRFSFEHEHVGPSQESRGEVSAWRR